MYTVNKHGSSFIPQREALHCTQL